MCRFISSLVFKKFLFSRIAVIISTDNVAQGHIMIEEEEEAVMKNLQSGGSGSYESPKDEFAHLLSKKRALKGSDNRDPDYIPE
jgi:hypothetical protein